MPLMTPDQLAELLVALRHASFADRDELLLAFLLSAYPTRHAQDS